MLKELKFSSNFARYINEASLKKRLVLCFCICFIIDMTNCSWLTHQAFAYRNNDQIQDLYSKCNFPFSAFRLLKRQSWKNRLFGLVFMFLQCSLQLRCGIIINPKNLIILASTNCSPLFCLFRRILNTKYFVLAVFVLVLCLSHQFSE